MKRCGFVLAIIFSLGNASLFGCAQPHANFIVKPIHGGIQTAICSDIILNSSIPTTPNIKPNSLHHLTNAENADCGPRALLLVLQHLNITCRLEKLRAAAETTGNGSTMSGLTKAVESVGLKAEGVQVNLEALAEVEMPAIAWVDHNHYIAVIASHGEGETGTVSIHDSNKISEEIVSDEQLLRMCSGYLLLIHK